MKNCLLGKIFQVKQMYMQIWAFIAANPSFKVICLDNFYGSASKHSKVALIKKNLTSLRKF